MTEETVTAPVEADAESTATPEEETTTDKETEVSEPEKSEGDEPPVETKEVSKRAKKRIHEDRQFKRQLKTQSQELKEMKDVLNEIKSRMVSENQSNIPELGNFETVEEWGKALLEHDKKSTPEPVNDGIDPEYKAWVDDSKEFLFEMGSEKYEDFEEVVTGDTTITEVMRDAIFEAENQADVAYFLGKNPKEARRIAKLPPIRQAVEIGKLDGKDWSPSKPKTSKAPAPIDPVGGGDTPQDGFREGMSQKDFAKQWAKMRGHNRG